MSVINRYGPVVQQYGSPEQLAQQDPRLLNQIITELGQSGEAQDQAAYEQLKEYYSPSVGGGAFIVHQDMKDAMTRQQQAYAQPVQPQPTGNPVYNAAMAAAKKSEPVITQAPTPAAKTESGYVTDATQLPKSSYWTATPSPEKPSVLNVSGTQLTSAGGTKITPPSGYAAVNIKPTVIEQEGVKVDAVSYDLAPLPDKSVTPQSIVASQPSQGFLADLASGLSKTTLNVKQSLPGLGVSVSGMMTPGEKSAVKTTGLIAVAGLAPVAGPAVGIGAKAVLAGEGLSVGVSQAFKLYGGGGLLTLEEATEAAALGGAMSLGGMGAQKALGLTGTGLKAAVGRVGVSTAMGAGVGTVYEYATTGEVTGAGASQGAAFGAAFGVAGEVARPVLGKASSKIQKKATDQITKSYEAHTKSTQEYFEATNYEAGLELKEYSLRYGEPQPGVWKPSLTESLIMKTTGAKPRPLAPSMVSFGSSPQSKGLSFQELEAASASFDFAVAPKSSLYTTSKLARPPSTSKAPMFGLSSDVYGLKTDIQRAEQAELEKQQLIDKSYGEIPSNQLEYSYEGPLSFKKTPVAPSSPAKVSGSSTVESTKNITTFDALQMAKEVAKQGKPIVNLRYGAAWGDLVAVQQSVKMQGGLMTSGMPFATAQGVSQVGKTIVNPFVAYGGKSYYGQAKAAEEYEQQFITMPGQVARLDTKAQSVVAAGTPSFMPPMTGGTTGFDVKPAPALPTQFEQTLTPDLTPSFMPIVVPDVKPVYVPDEAMSPMPMFDVVTETVPKQIQPLIEQTKQTPYSPAPSIKTPKVFMPHLERGSASPWGGPSAFSPARRRSKKLAVWEFPVADPKKVAEAFKL